MKQAGKTIRAARANGHSIESVLAVVKYFSDRRPAWGPGALSKRLTDGFPTDPPEDGWPQPKVPTQSKIVSPEHINGKYNAARVGPGQRYAPSAEETNALAELQQMPPGDLDALAAKVFGDNAMYRESFRKHRVSELGHAAPDRLVDYLLETQHSPQCFT